MNIDWDIAKKARTWVLHDIVTESKAEPRFEPGACLERLEFFNEWVSDCETRSEIASILTGVHQCRQNHLLDRFLYPEFYTSITAKPDKKFVKELITMYYDSVVHYMKCL